MVDCSEALFISTLNNERASCCVQDLRTGTDLMRYKGGGTMQPRSLQMLDDDFVIAANSTKPLLHVWPINGQEQLASIRYVVPGKVNALALTPDSAFLIVAIQETIYVWHMNTGRLLNTLSKHYQPITCIRFTDNGEHFATAGKDGAVLFWNLTRATAPLGGADSEDNAPHYSFNDHGLAVTDIHIGMGASRAFMYTVSLDRCCKVYDLCDGSMLLSVVFPVALHSIIVDRLETRVYVGTGEGQVLIFHMDKVPRMKEYHLEEEESQAFVGHTAGSAITCLALSMSAGQLISGGEDKQVCIWDVSSRQLMKSIPQPGAVTNLYVGLIASTRFHPGPKKIKFFADNLKRMITPPEEEDYVIELLITEENCKVPEFPPLNFDNCYDGCTEGVEGLEGGVDTDFEFNEDEILAQLAAADLDDTSDDNAQDEEMTGSEVSELDKLRAENARLKLELQRLNNTKAEKEEDATAAAGAPSRKSAKRGGKRARKN